MMDDRKRSLIRLTQTTFAFADDALAAIQLFQQEHPDVANDRVLAVATHRLTSILRTIECTEPALCRAPHLRSSKQ